MTLTSDPQTPTGTTGSPVLDKTIVAMARRLLAITEAYEQIGAWSAKHPEIKLVPHPGVETRVAIYANTPEEWSARAAALKDGAAIGDVTKRSGEQVLYCTREFGIVTVEVFGLHEQVCERVQTGTEKRTVPDPALVAELPTVEVEEPVYEWKCPPVLGGSDAA